MRHNHLNCVLPRIRGRDDDNKLCGVSTTHIQQRQNKPLGSGFVREEVQDLTNEVRREKQTGATPASQSRGMVEQC